MGILVVGLILFLGVHSVGIVAPAWRERMIERPQQIHTAAPSRANDAIAIVLGLGVYVVFGIWLHRVLIGVPAIVT